jgi:hypothetical protein
MSSWALSRERTPNTCPSRARFPEFPQSLAPTNLWMSCDAGLTSLRPSAGLPRRTIESVCDFGLLPEGFAFRRAWFRQHQRGHSSNGKAFQPVGTGALRWRLFDFGKVAAEVTQSRGAYAEALAEYRQAALRATEDVENALMELAQTQVRLEELQGEVRSLTRARDLSERAYKAGAIPLTDVLDADRQLLVARNDVESTRADASRAAVHTFRALGGGWDARSNPSLSAIK